MFISACTAPISGKAKVDSTWSAETRQLESEAAAYAGPQYSIGIVPFDTRATALGSGVSDAMMNRLRTQLEATGLNTVPADELAPRELDTSRGPQRSGTGNNTNMSVDYGLDTLDFRLSGTITSYSEAEQGGNDAPQNKSVLARVTLDYVLIESSTGKQLIADSATGEFRKPSTAASALAARPSIDPNLRDGALRNALARTTLSLIRKLGSMPFQGKLLAVDGSSLVLKAGLRSRLREGTQLTVYRVSKALVDPDNGRVLGYRESKIGIIQIGNHLNANLSKATAVSGNGFQTGDVARLTPQDGDLVRQTGALQ